MKPHELGQWGEEQAENYIKEQGYLLLERNYSNHMGEIDLIARDGEILVFIEVKTRSSSSFGSPLEAVGLSKQRQIYRLAQAYLQSRRLPETKCRFDVIGIELQDGSGVEIIHIKGAFGG
ncbi:MAG: YraN family protein [Halanaerobium sp.]|nr:YraN family protein [Halanaerobium sp.]